MHRRWGIRGAVLLVSALFCALLFWAGGFSVESWLSWANFGELHASSDTNFVGSAGKPLNGAVLVTPPAPTGNDSSVSATPRRLVLVDTHPGRNPNEGTARLGVNSSSPQTYVAGAILVNGARLREIYSDHVLLERDGRSARLGVDDTSSAGTPSASDAPLTVVGAQPPTSAAPATSTEPLTDYLRPSPVFDGAKLVGYQVYPGAHADTFAQLGLRGGDVITAVDGAAVIDAATTIDQLKGLVQGRAVTADLVRNGHRMTISMDGAVIASSRAAAPAAASTVGQGSKNSH